MNYSQVTGVRLRDIVALNQKIFSSLYPWPPYSLEQYEAKLTSVAPTIFIAEENDQLVADSIAFAQNDNFYLWILGVDEKFRRQGVASKLFALNEQAARELGCKNLTIKIYSVSPEMTRLALKRGYLITSTEKTEDQNYEVKMLELAL